MRLCSLFAGIGGFDLAARWMGWATAVLVEWDPFARQVLIKNFNCIPAENLSAAELATIIDAWEAWRIGQPHPTTVLYGDICCFDACAWHGAIDLICGGFPCQPWSDAGLKLGTADPRHLWPQMLRIIREIQPLNVVGENVRGLLNWQGGIQFESVCADLEIEGYEVQPLLLPACGVGAPHRRDRIWFVAHANGPGLQGRSQFRGVRGIRPDEPQHTERHVPPAWQDFPTEPPLRSAINGVSPRLVRTLSPPAKQLKAYGNAIVPQVAYEIFKAIQSVEETLSQPVIA